METVIDNELIDLARRFYQVCKFFAHGKEVGFAVDPTREQKREFVERIGSIAKNFITPKDSRRMTVFKDNNMSQPIKITATPDTRFGLMFAETADQFVFGVCDPNIEGDYFAAVGVTALFWSMAHESDLEGRRVSAIFDRYKTISLFLNLKKQVEALEKIMQEALQPEVSEAEAFLRKNSQNIEFNHTFGTW